MYHFYQSPYTTHTQTHTDIFSAYLKSNSSISNVQCLNNMLLWLLQETGNLFTAISLQWFSKQTSSHISFCSLWVMVSLLQYNKVLMMLLHSVNMNKWPTDVPKFWDAACDHPLDLNTCWIIPWQNSKVEAFHSCEWKCVHILCNKNVFKKINIWDYEDQLISWLQLNTSYL